MIGRLLAILFAAFLFAAPAAQAQLLTTGAGPGGFGSSAPAFLPENRPSTLALSPNATTTGDSIPVGVGVADASTYSYQNQLQALMSSGTIVKDAVGGAAWNLPAWTGSPGNPSPIPNQITGSTNYATNTQLTNGSVNGYNASVVQGGAAEAQDWVSYVQSGISSALSGLSQPWVYFLGPYSEINGPGMQRYASWRLLLSNLRTTYGGHAYDLPRALQYRGSTNASTIDYQNVQTYGGLPLTFRGMPQDPPGTVVPFADTTLPTAWLTCTTATNTSAGIAAAAGCGDPALQAEGALAQNLSTSSNIPNDNIWRVGIVSAAKKWVKVDLLHLSRWGSTPWAQEVSFDILAALQGAGAPVANPSELFCAQDAAASTSCGTIYYIGQSAPATATLFDSAGNAVTTLTTSIGSPTGGYGAITVTRTATGSLTEGEQQFVLQTTDGSGHVLHAPVDFRIGEPSTQTVPRLARIPGTVGNESSAFTMAGIDDHGMNNAGKYWVLLWVKPVSVASDIEYIVDLHTENGSEAELYVRINTAGQLNVVARDDSDTVISNTTTTNVFADNVATWVLIDIDFTVAGAPTIKGVFCKDACGTNSTINATGLGTGPYTTSLSKTRPRFFALLDATLNDWNRGGSPIATRDQFTGWFGQVAVGNGVTGIGTDGTVANAIWTASTGLPVARACGAAVGGGGTPVFEIRGGIGDLLRGGCQWQTSPVFGTRRGILGLTY